MASQASPHDRRLRQLRRAALAALVPRRRCRKTPAPPRPGLSGCGCAGALHAEGAVAAKAGLTLWSLREVGSATEFLSRALGSLHSCLIGQDLRATTSSSQAQMPVLMNAGHLPASRAVAFDERARCGFAICCDSAKAEGLSTVTTRFGFVSTYPPTLCGLATFTASLFSELAGSGDGSGRVVSVVDDPQPRAGAEVIGELVAGDPRSARHAAELLLDSDVAIVQHEYGVYGGADGDEILTLFDALTIPSIVVLHTVLSAPTAHQRTVLESIAAAADAVVTMTATARDRLASGYKVDMAKVTVIPHGAPAVRVSRVPTFRSVEPLVLTWGLLGPGKGIEWGIEAMSMLGNLYPAPRYLIAGRTHPKVLLRNGEAYRDQLKQQVHALALTTRVRFDSQYRDSAALADLVNSADVVLLPYDSTDQVTSGVLIEAVAALKPVIATGFPHAIELLKDGAGLLVPHKDPAAIADALRTVLTNRELAAGMAKTAIATAPELLWPAVAQRYRELAARLISDRVAA